MYSLSRSLLSPTLDKRCAASPQLRAGDTSCGVTQEEWVVCRERGVCPVGVHAGQRRKRKEATMVPATEEQLPEGARCHAARADVQEGVGDATPTQGGQVAKPETISKTF